MPPQARINTDLKEALGTSKEDRGTQECTKNRTMTTYSIALLLAILGGGPWLFSVRCFLAPGKAILYTVQAMPACPVEGRVLVEIQTVLIIR